MKKTRLLDVQKYVYNSKKITVFLQAVNAFVSLSTAAVFFTLFFEFLFESPIKVVKFLVVVGAPFIAVTVARRIINAKRPYEIYDFYKNPPKAKKGSSFPSRHAVSVLAVATVALFFKWYLGVPLMLLGAMMCAARVLLGIHFIKDVFAGSLAGIVCAVIGTLILL